MFSIPVLVHTTLVGIGATALMDAWLALQTRLGLPGTSFGLIGRWVGHMRHGRWTHGAIAKAPPVRFERSLGWLTHYAVGITFAALLVAVQGVTWLMRPTPGPALVFGLITVAAPWFVMQPAMGAGWAASRTASPLQNRLRSLLNHAVFGGGLYLSAAALASASA